jgi:hypothetical protein
MTRRRTSFFPWNRAPAEPDAAGPRQGLSNAFGLRLKFERKGLNLHITLETETDRRKAAADAVPRTEAPPPPVPVPQDTSIRRMQTQLRELLHRHPGTRSVLPELVLFERLLRHGGERAFAEPPFEVLKFALAQLEAIEPRREQPDLAALHARLTLAVVKREALAHGPGGAPLRSDFMDERRLKVSEASASDFAKAEAGWPEPEPKVKPG